MVLHGIALHLMILHSLACHCIVSYGIAWYCIISYGIAWYCIVGFGAWAVSRKTPIYFMIMIVNIAIITNAVQHHSLMTWVYQLVSNEIKVQ